MNEHPIQGLMQTSMENLKKMIDVSTIIGDPVQTPNGDVIMSISKVSFGFAAGGSDFTTSGTHQKSDANNASVELPFGGGSGGGVTINPIAFLVVGTSGVRIVPLDNQTHLMDRVIDHIPQVMNMVQDAFKPKDKIDVEIHSQDHLI
ncbi:GerW family sporulation protein [Paenibacillus mendelii]|uniref:GerW family sporulation protein n=1 Tax=Paenibacillus mendelii TaxID=206163 RepID=A0ABV6JH28_9BACL|nr:GerW family sporulation protein [Paenibacillus mendelii]MCQ6558082.1 GerW family sporulation protein [Paenibacillus mendelii]